LKIDAINSILKKKKIAALQLQAFATMALKTYNCMKRIFKPTLEMKNYTTCNTFSLKFLIKRITFRR
jgi:hypothetical protein